MEQLKVTSIKYTSSNGEETERTVIPVRVPSKNVTTMDVTDVSAKEREQLVQQLSDYMEYVKIIESQKFSFEDFVEQQTGQRPDVKWRALKQENIIEN